MLPASSKAKSIAPSIACREERRRKKKRWMIFLEGTRKGLVSQINPGTVLKGNTGETSETRGEAHKGFLERVDTILNRTELLSKSWVQSLHSFVPAFRQDRFFNPTGQNVRIIACTGFFWLKSQISPKRLPRERKPNKNTGPTETACHISSRSNISQQGS